jgi:hypothetical protein
LPWEQENTGGRGEMRLVANSTFVAELSVSYPIPEWGGKELVFPLEDGVAFTPHGASFIDCRQTKFYVIN